MEFKKRKRRQLSMLTILPLLAMTLLSSKAESQIVASRGCNCYSHGCSSLSVGLAGDPPASAGHIFMDVEEAMVDTDGHFVSRTHVVRHELKGTNQFLGAIEVSYDTSNPAPSGQLRSIHADQPFPATHTVHLNWLMKAENLPDMVLETSEPVTFRSEPLSQWPQATMTYTLLTDVTFESPSAPGEPVFQWCSAGTTILVTHPLSPCLDTEPENFLVGGNSGNLTALSTGIEVTSGQPLQVAVVGEVCLDSEGTSCFDAGTPSAEFSEDAWLPSAPLASLVGEIDGEIFPIGESFAGTAPASGELRIGINDVNYEDNSGQVLAYVTVCEGSVVAVPTLSTWGVVLLAVAVMGLATMQILKRRKTISSRETK